MPELPEVVNVAQKLNNEIKDTKIIKVSVVLAKVIKEIDHNIFSKSVTNSTITKVDNISKHLIFYLDNGKVIISHLRLEGKFKIYSSESEIVKHDLVLFYLSNNKILAFYDHRMFATMHLKDIKSFRAEKPIVNVAKIPMEMTGKELYERIYKKGIAIKSTLLDQSIIAGLGNIYVNEVLWFVKINPTTPSNKITLQQCDEIIKYSVLVLTKATEMGGSTISSFESLNGEEGTYQALLEVHMKKGQKCSRCQSLIEKIQVNGRGTYFCPICQK